MTPDRIAAVILASGQSQRFGAGNKLLASLHGQAIAVYSAKTIRQAGFAYSFAVVPSLEAELSALYREENITVVPNETPEAGQGASLALGARAAAGTDAEAMLVILADMPFVTSADLLMLCSAIGEAEAAASEAEGRQMPPVLFRRELFPALSSLTGDRGGRDFLRHLRDVAVVPMRAAAAIDIDTQAALDQIERG